MKTGKQLAKTVLSDVGKKEWKRMGKKLLKTGMLTEVNRIVLAAYCQHYENWVDATSQIRKHGMLIKTQSGFPMLSPWYMVQSRESAAMLKCLTELKVMT